MGPKLQKPRHFAQKSLQLQNNYWKSTKKISNSLYLLENHYWKSTIFIDRFSWQHAVRYRLEVRSICSTGIPLHIFPFPPKFFSCFRNCSRSKSRLKEALEFP